MAVVGRLIQIVYVCVVHHGVRIATEEFTRNQGKLDTNVISMKEIMHSSPAAVL